MEPVPKLIELSDAYVQQIMTDLEFVPQPTAVARKRGWYGVGNRSFGIDGSYQGREAHLKVLADPREIDSAEAYRQFLTIPERGHLRAPALLHGEQKGRGVTVLVMEQLPSEAQPLQSPLSVDERQAFLRGPFADLMRVKDQLAYRDPVAEEQVSAAAFCHERFERWRQLAAARLADESVEQSWLTTAVLAQQELEAALTSLYQDKPLEWTHGLPKPDKFHRLGEEYYLTDFKLVGMRPAGYDIAMVIWADAIMPLLADQSGRDAQHMAERITTEMTSYVQTWEQVAAEQGLPVNSQAITLMLKERLLGTLYADTIANRQLPLPEVKRRAEIVLSLLHSRV